MVWGMCPELQPKPQNLTGELEEDIELKMLISVFYHLSKQWGAVETLIRLQPFQQMINM